MRPQTVQPHRLRLRLTLLYCVVSVVSGAVLLAIIYGLSRGLPPSDVPVPPGGPVAQPIVPGQQTRTDLLVLPGIALAIMAVLSLAVGWVIAGRVLRPIRTMTGRLQQISGRNVHERLAVAGPRDEFKDLADTVDGLLGRLEAALDGHKRFVANAAHELRTPLTVEHALLEEPLIDPDAGVESYRANFERLLAVSRHRGQLLESLLILAVSEQATLTGGDRATLTGGDRAGLAGGEPGGGRPEPVDLAELVAQAVRDRVAECDRRGLRVTAAVRPAAISGDPTLIARLVANLYDNAMHYNAPGGLIEIRTGHTSLVIANTGPAVPPDQVQRIFEPFQRLHRVADDAHHGLGLSIVRAIADAHGATLTAHARPAGGLAVEVAFPPATG